MSIREPEYRESLLAFHGALGELRDRLGADSDEVRDSILRLARSLAILAERRPARRIEDAATAVAEAEAEELEIRLEELWAQLQKATAAAPSNPVRVMIVEPDTYRAKLLQSALSASHREVVITTDGIAAERQLTRRRFGMIVMARTLSDIDSRDLVARLRSKARTATTPIFLVGSAGDRGVVLEHLALGADRWFDTPVDPNRLAAEVNATMKASHASEGRVHLDPLTGLSNVDGFTEAFERMVAFCRRSGSPLTLALIELAGLRAINDSEGDEAGDACLVHAAGILREALRQSDLIARWDGDAFATLFPNTNVDGSVVALKKIRERLQAAEFRLPSGTVVSLDIVAAVVEAADCERAGDAVEPADEVLQQARRVGPGTVLSAAEAPGTYSNIVLLAEDDPISASVVRHRLSRDGFDVHVFPDGEEALEGAAELDVMVFILDVKLPGIDGFELLRRFRADERYENAPIAIVSALGREDDVVRGLELGADDYIPKPFSTSELRARVLRMLEKRGIPTPQSPDAPVPA